jgi:hypothetical protein
MEVLLAGSLAHVALFWLVGSLHSKASAAEKTMSLS